MIEGRFYFIKDKYFEDFDDPYLMRNKEYSGGAAHDRPCFFVFKDGNTDLYWLIPVSSKIEKFKRVYNSKISRGKRCDTLVFGEILGKECVYLIQNMCPITPEYIENEYVDSKYNVPVMISLTTQNELVLKAKRVLRLQRKGIHVIFPDVLAIERKLLNK